jgi:hypothetical protein
MAFYHPLHQVNIILVVALMTSIFAIKRGLWKVCKKMMGSEPNFSLTAVKREFAAFKNKQHSFGDIDVNASSKELAAHEW